MAGRPDQFAGSGCPRHVLLFPLSEATQVSSAAFLYTQYIAII